MNDEPVQVELRASKVQRLVALFGFVLLTGTAHAACLPSTDPHLSKFESALRANPAAVELQVTNELNAKTSADPTRRAGLFAILAESYSVQEKHADVRKAVDGGLALIDDVRHPVHVNLLYLDANRTLEQDEVAPAVKRAEASVAAQVKGSPAEACALATLGILEHMADRTDVASMHLTRAYRMSAGPERLQQRMIAAGLLSIVMEALGDYPTALSLTRELVAWHTQRDSPLELSAAYFLEGFVLTQIGERAAARKSLLRSRDLSERLHDPLGVAYANINLCLNEIAVDATRLARSYCSAALQAFTAANLVEPRKQALTGLAEIELLENNPQAALAHLNDVLDQDGRDLPPFRLAHVFELRGRAHRELGNDRAALADFQNYMQRFIANKEDQRAREASSMRARFEVDREIERNEFLQRELQAKSERLAAQSARLRWMITSGIAGLGVIGLLTYQLLAHRRQKRLLSRMAREDELTGLANRRFTLRRATQAFEELRTHGHPFALAILDLDHFKKINDQLGHAAGDYVLKEFARVGREKLRSTDLLGRWGGEEFLILLPNTTLDVALTIVERVRAAAATINGGPLPDGFMVTLSGGLATHASKSATLEQTIAQADHALYAAKRRGRNFVQVAQESYDASPPTIRKTLKAAGVDLATGRFVAIGP